MELQSQDNEPSNITMRNNGLELILNDTGEVFFNGKILAVDTELVEAFRKFLDLAEKHGNYEDLRTVKE